MTKKVLIGTGMIVLAAAVTVLASGKASWLDRLRGDDSKVLRHRMEAYWQARMAGDADAQEQFAHPMQKAGVRSDLLVTDAYTIEGLEIRGDAAIGTVKVRSHLNQPQLANLTRESVLKTKWVRYEGEWYQDIGPTNLRDVLKDAQRRMHPDEVAAHDASTAPLANKGEAIVEEPRNN